MRKQQLDDEATDLVFRPELFESRAWIRITNAIGWPDYRPLVAELEEVPRDNRTGSTQSIMVLVSRNS